MTISPRRLRLLERRGIPAARARLIEGVVVVVKATVPLRWKLRQILQKWASLFWPLVIGFQLAVST